jgi:glycosyltransferase involved in cell wall biosynthesis
LVGGLEVKKEKIGFIFDKDLDDFTHSSGTVAFLKEILSETYEIYPIIVKDSYLKRKIIRAIKKLSHNDNKNVRLPFTPLESLKLNKLVNDATKNGVRVFFAPVASELAARTMKPNNTVLVYLSDATYHAMVDYYFFESKFCQWIGNKNERKSLQKADAIIYSSEWAKKDAVEYYGIPSNKIHVLPFGANLKDDYEIKSEKSFGKGTVVNMLLCGVAWERKGVDIAIKCIETLNLHDKGRKYNLTIIGLDKPDGRNFDNVTFVGRMNKNNEDEYSRMIEIYKNSDVFILPTKAECAGIVFAEAAMYGLPVFTHITGGVETYVKDRVTGRCLPLGSTGEDFAKAIMEMFDSNKYYEYSQNARKYYEETLNWSKWLMEFQSILH